MEWDSRLIIIAAGVLIVIIALGLIISRIFIRPSTVPTVGVTTPTPFVSGTPKVSPPVITLQPVSKVKVFFVNTLKDPTDCGQVFSVERDIQKTTTPFQPAVLELLKGPNEAEREQGFSTSINQDARVQGLKIENGTARVDFNDALQSGVTGSCRINSIRSQISETLKQFPNIKNVVISINGKTPNTIQP